MKRSFKKNIFENQVERNKAWANNLHLYEKNQAFLDEKYSTKSKEEIFDEIQIGEVIYAKMPFSPEKMEKIPVLHRQRPYIVVGKKKKILIAYPASHKMPNHQDEEYIFRIHSSLNKYYHRSGEIFRSWTDSHYDLKKAYHIPIENIIEVFQIPNRSDIQRLERQLIQLKNKGKKVFPMNIEFPIREGDVVAFEKDDFEEFEYYYVYSSYKEEIYAHSILPARDCFDQFQLKGSRFRQKDELVKEHKFDIENKSGQKHKSDMETESKKEHKSDMESHTSKQNKSRIERKSEKIHEPGQENQSKKRVSDDIEITIAEQDFVILTQTQKKLKKSDCVNLVFSVTQKEVEQINALKKQLKQKQKEWKNKEKTLKQIRFYFEPGQMLHFRYGYEKYFYLYSNKDAFYALNFEEYNKIEHILKSQKEYKEMIELEKLTEIHNYDAQRERADITMMKTIVEKAFDGNNAHIRDLLLKKLRTEEEKFRDLILSVEESAEILLRYYGLSQ